MLGFEEFLSEARTRSSIVASVMNSAWSKFFGAEKQYNSLKLWAEMFWTTITPNVRPGSIVFLFENPSNTSMDLQNYLRNVDILQGVELEGADKERASHKNIRDQRDKEFSLLGKARNEGVPFSQYYDSSQFIENLRKQLAKIEAGLSTYQSEFGGTKGPIFNLLGPDIVTSGETHIIELVPWGSRDIKQLETGITDVNGNTVIPPMARKDLKELYKLGVWAADRLIRASKPKLVFLTPASLKIASNSKESLKFIQAKPFATKKYGNYSLAITNVGETFGIKLPQHPSKLSYLGKENIEIFRQDFQNVVQAIMKGKKSEIQKILS